SVGSYLSSFFRHTDYYDGRTGNPASQNTQSQANELLQCSPVIVKSLPRGVGSPSANPEADVANGLAAEAFFELSQDVDLRNLFEFVMQCRLEHADIENSVTQREGRRMRGNEFANDLRPRVDYFSFMQALTKSQALHQLRNQLRRRLPAVGLHFPLTQAAPFSNHGGTKRWRHKNYLATDGHG